MYFKIEVSSKISHIMRLLTKSKDTRNSLQNPEKLDKGILYVLRGTKKEREKTRAKN